jgi:hypothetical protein
LSGERFEVRGERVEQRRKVSRFEGRAFPCVLG